jgi:tetratricopeptide (TPR) repeat protein
VSIAGFAAVAVALVRERRASAREHASAERARFEADTAEETITLLTKLLTLADPESARDKPPTVREVVDRGAALVAGELQGNEALRARLLHVLGTVSSTIGANEQAERMLAEALPLRRELYGASDSRSLDTQIALASVVAVRGRPRDARAMFADAQEAQRLAPDPNDRRAADIEHGLGFVTFQLGELSEAIQHFRRAHELRRRAFGDDDRDARRSLSALAAALAQAGQLEQARDALEEVLRLDLASLGETSPTTLNAMMNLATTYTQLGDFAAAEELDRRVLAIQDRVLGPDHVERATTLLNLSGIVLRLGRSDEARALAHAALDIRCEHFAPDDPRIANVYTSLGYLDLERGALASAQAWFETAYANLLRQRGPGHFDTLSAANNLADVYQRTGRAAEAEALARTVLAERIKLDPGHRYRLLTETILARSLADLGRHQEARELLREVVSLTADPRELAERSSLLAELDRPRGSR